MEGFVEVILRDRPSSEDPSALLGWVERWAAPLAGDAEAVLELIEAIADDDGDNGARDVCLSLLSRALDEARRNRENSEPGAALFFDLVGTGITGLIDTGGLEASARFGLCQAYLRAGLTPPDQLRIAPEALEALDLGEMPDLPDISGLVDELIPTEGSPFDAYTALRDVIGAMPEEMTAALLTQMIGQDAPRSVAMGRYFLLDPIEGIRKAAVAGFTLLVERPGVDAGLLSDLILIRNWIPDGASLDPTIKTALGREPAGGNVAQPWRLHRVLTSLPDGTGSQSIMGLCSRGKTRAIAVALIKQGHGVKDAYVIPCASRTEQERLLEQIEHSMPFHEVTPAYLKLAISLALADGLSHGAVPNAGLLDVAPMLGLGDITPGGDGLGAYLEQADPDGALAALSDNRRGRLVGSSRDWFDTYEISSSWFVSDGDLIAGLERARTAASVKKTVWAHLETQRDLWARHFARSALILRYSSTATAEAWMSFAAVATALDHGRGLKTIPVFQDILNLTLEVVASRSGPQDTRGDMDPELAAFDPPDITPEAKGEFARLLKGTRLSPDFVDGFLMAVLISPEFQTPSAWLPALLAGAEDQNEDSLQRMLDILMMRYGSLNEMVLMDDAGAAVSDLSKRRFRGWTKGFAYAVDEVDGAWPKRALARDDKKVLNLIRSTATEDPTATLQPLLPSWLESASRKWR